RQRSVLLPSSCRDTLEPAVTFPRRAPDVDEAATNPWSRGRPRTFTSPERFRRISRAGGSRGGAGPRGAARGRTGARADRDLRMAGVLGGLSEGAVAP